MLSHARPFIRACPPSTANPALGLRLSKRTYLHALSQVGSPSQHTMDMIEMYSQRRQTGVTLRQMMEFGEHPTTKVLGQAAQFLHHELPIRLAHRVQDLERLPHGLAKMPSIDRVKHWYIKSFEDLVHFPKVTSPKEEEAFTRLIQNIYERHAPTLVTVAKGVWEFRRHLARQQGLKSKREIRRALADYDDIHRFLDDFYMSRIGIRMLIGQHIELHQDVKAGFVGLIAKKTSPYEVTKAAIEDASYMCERQHGDAPKVLFYGDTDSHFPYVPSHLYYMLVELLKNSLRAVVETHGVDGTMPEVKVIIADDGEGAEDVAIKVSDEGGGIPRSEMPRIWSYLFTTANAHFESTSDDDDLAPDFGTDAPLAGLGYGLPVSRLYARYFGGDLQVISMEGYGTDAYLHVPRLADRAEPLP